MRNILFRGKCKNAYEGNWVEGFVFVTRKNKYNIKWYNSQYGTSQTSEVFPETVGQYTGFTDRNGAKIFEGDIVRAGLSEFLFEVGFSQEYGQFKIFALCRNISASMNCDIEYKVVGNIHDNPELLKGGAE